MKRTLRWFGALCLVLHAFAATAATIVELRSDPGDYIGGGITRTFTTDTGSFTVNHVLDNLVSIEYRAATGYSWWGFDFAAPSGAALVADNYEDATRYPFQSPTKPGLDVFGDGRGCNRLTGRFIVREAVYGSAGEVLRFAVDFEQHCEGMTPALWGFLRYNSDIPLHVPEPNAAAGPDRNVLEGEGVTLDGGRSADADGAIVSYRWRQVSGPTAPLTTPDAVQTGFTAPAVPEGGADLVFELEVRDDAGLVDVDTVKVHVADEYDPQFWIYFSSEPGDWIGQGKVWDMGVDDGVFRATRYSDNAVNVNFDNESWWNLTFAAPGGVPLAPGAYEGAARWPFQGPGQPGLDISGDGRGCNTLTGRFVVHEAVYGADNGIDSFAADFEQHCEGGAAALFGTVRYNYRKPKPPTADLSLSLSDSPDPVKFGRLLTYTADVTNQGPDAATGATLVLRLPRYANFKYTNGNCTLADDLLTCALGDMAPGAAQSVRVVVQPKKRGSVYAAARVTASEVEPTPENNTALATTTVE